MSGPRSLRMPVCIIAIVWFGACASMVAVNRDIDALMQAGRYREAAERLEEARDLYGERNQLLYALELAIILHYAGDYEESNVAFERAKALAEANYTRSVTRELGSWAVNDRVLDYAGVNFERAMIHVFAALNYTQLARRDGALVEARQLDHLLKTFETNYGDAYSYQRDAFGLYLSGMLFEDAAAWDDAYVAYWQALEAYERYARYYGVAAPESLREAGARAAARVGFGAAREFEMRWGRGEAEVGPLVAFSMPWMPPLPALGKIVVVHYNGRAPRKVEQFFDMSFGEGWAYVNATTAEGVDEEQLATATAVAASIPASDTIRIALPKYVESDYAIERVEVRVAGWARIGPSELVQDVGAIAIGDFEDRMLAIRTKAIARAAIKYALAKSVSEGARREKRGGRGKRGREDAGRGDDQRAAEELIGALLRAYAVVSERADTRSWSALPDEIWLAEVDVPVGVHGVELAFRGEDGRIVRTQRATVRARSDQRAFLIARTLQ